MCITKSLHLIQLTLSLIKFQITTYVPPSSSPQHQLFLSSFEESVFLPPAHSKDFFC